MELKGMGIWGRVWVAYEAWTQMLKDALVCVAGGQLECLLHHQGLHTFTKCKKQVSLPFSWDSCLLVLMRCLGFLFSS